MKTYNVVYCYDITHVIESFSSMEEAQAFIKGAETFDEALQYNLTVVDSNNE